MKNTGYHNNMMDTGIQFQLVNADEFKAKLDAISKRVKSQMTRKALLAGAEVIFESIYAATPKKTGRTVSELKVKEFSRAGGHTVSVYFDNTWPWTALFLEKGTVPSVRKGRLNVYRLLGEMISQRRAVKELREQGQWRQPPTGFMAKAFEQAAPAAAQAMGNSLRADLA